jgi:hypothetical protein
LDYNSPHLNPLRKWVGEGGRVYVNGKLQNGNDTLIDSKLGLLFDMREHKDVQLLKNFSPFTFPPFDKINIHNLSEAEEEVKHFLVHSLGQIRELGVNSNGDLLDGSGWVEAIIKTLPNVKEMVELGHLSFSKEQMEAIVNNSLHLKTLKVYECKLRKWSF